MIVSIMLVVTAEQGLGATGERMIGPQGTNYEAVLVPLERDAGTGAEITAFFWAREERCKGPDRAAVLILSKRLINAPEGQVRPVAEKGVRAIRRYCQGLSRPFTHGTIAVLVRPPSVTINANGQMEPGGTKLVVDIQFDDRQRPDEAKKKSGMVEIDQVTGTRFMVLDCSIVTKVKGDVPPHINLTPEATAVALLEKGKALGLRTCTTKPGGIGVDLYQGDTRMVGYYFHWSTGYSFIRGRGSFGEYYNKGASELAQEQERQRQVEEAARREAEARRAREQQAAAQQEAQRLLAEFTQKNRITDWPNGQALQTNPFIYEGKVIGVLAHFERMISATSGVFYLPPQGWGPGTSLVISDIPKGLLTTQVLTKVAATVEGLNADGVVQLKYRDLLVCGDQACEKIHKP
jgi:hypothetical protein